MNYSVALGPSILVGNDSGAASTNNIDYAYYRPSDVTASAQVFGGYHAASFTVRTTAHHIDSLLASLGGDTRLFNHYGVQVWEGFVDKITITIGKATLTVGPVSGIANKILMKYQGYSWNVLGVNIYEGNLETGWVTNADSIAKWGTLEEIVSGQRGMEDTEADRAVAELIKRKAAPGVAKDLSVGGFLSEAQRGIEARFECLGYYHLLKKKYYFVDEADTWDAADMIADIVAAHKLFSGWGILQTNQSVGKYTEEEAPGLEVIEGILAELSTNSGYGFVFGVYDNRAVELREITTQREPDYYISANTGQLVDRGGNTVASDVRPGSWVAATGFTIPFYDDRMINGLFPIQSVEYRADGGITVNEMKFSLIADLLQETGI